MYLITSKIKAYYHSQGKRVTKEAIEALNRKIERIMAISVTNAKHFNTITEIEIPTPNKRGE